MNYSPWHALGGGALIGLASLLAAALTGKIPSISGVVARVMQGAKNDTLWRFLFLFGLIAGAGIALQFVASASVVLGSAVFGIGWGIAGFCPGPALANLAAFRTEALFFLPFMLIGMRLSREG